MKQVLADEPIVRDQIRLPGGYTVPSFLKWHFLGQVVSALLPYLFWLAGTILFGAIIVSGFQFLTSAGDPKKTASAKGCLTNAALGFLIIFISWWLIQIIQDVFNLTILGG